jgi:hypothetical protein
MSAIAYCDGAYTCTACHRPLEIPAGANVRQGFSTVRDGARERVLFVNGQEVHRCTDNETDGLGRTSTFKRRR